MFFALCIFVFFFNIVFTYAYFEHLSIKIINYNVYFAFIYLFVEAHRALELLEDYHSRLSAPQDRTLRIAIERVIRIFKSRLFQALLGK